MQILPDQNVANSLPVADEIRAAMGRMFAVDPFRESPQLMAFLKFVVEESLRGKGADLKGYTIATLALGRPEDFDPQTDPIVRVQAGRVRQAMQEYYQVHAGDPVRIIFEKGSYQPQFAFNQSSVGQVSIPAARIVSGAPPESSKHKAKYHMTPNGILGVATISAILSIAGMVMFGVLAPKPVKVTSGPRQSYFPVIIVDGGNGPSDPLETLSVVQRTQDALTRFDDIIVVRDSQDERGSSQLTPVRSKAERLVLKITGTYADRGRIRLSARLVEQLDQRVLWVQEFEPIMSGTAGDEGRTDIVRAIATTIARPYGVVHAYARQVFAATDAAQSDFGCIIIAFDYWLQNDRDTRLRAIKCIEEQLLKTPKLGAMHSQLAYLHLDDYRIGDGDQQKPPLDRAIASANRGVSFSPTSARSYQALLAVHFVRKEMDSAWRAADQALKLNPFDSEILADVAVRYIQAGQIEKGLAQLEASMLLNNSPAEWIVTYRALALYMLGRHDEAAIVVKPITASEFPLAMLGTILVAFHEKDQQGAIERINTLKRTYPQIFANPKAYFERINLERGMMNFLLSRYHVALAWAGQST